MPIIIGVAVGAVALIAVLVMMSGGKGGDTDSGGGKKQTPAASQKSQPSKRSATAPTGSARAGSAPERPAPELTQAMLNKAASLLEEAKALNRLGVTARNNGKNTEARAKNSEAKAKIDELKAVLADALGWQEEADMEDWAQPAEYDALGKLWIRISKTQKSIRMGGGS
ncbi:MAG: hypothetical protein AB8H80_01530 [Planctomycetota bacterium]